MLAKTARVGQKNHCDFQVGSYVLAFLSALAVTIVLVTTLTPILPMQMGLQSGCAVGDVSFCLITGTSHALEFLIEIRFIKLNLTSRAYHIRLS